MPLVPADSFRPMEGINPTLEVAGVQYLLITQQITAIKASEMRCCVAYLPATEGVVVTALDRLLTTA